jgi:hypothetical protein
MEYMIRIDDQSCYNEKGEYMGAKQVLSYLETSGLKVRGWKWSAFGACYFACVSGEYTGHLEIQKLSTRPQDFSWLM